jgi:capsule polysaccharide modification protein KpsS
MLPKDTFLYVKEHPTYWRSNQIEGMHKVRSKRVYKEMSSLDGVKLLTVNSNPYELIFNSIGVITITGTCAFEAFGFNKPALVLGNYFYNQFANAYHPYTMDELRNALHEMTLKNNDYSDSFLATLKSLEKISISLTSNDPKVNKEAVIKMLADVILES